MSVFSRVRRGCHLGYHSLKIVFRDKTLLLFPLMTTTCAITMVAAFYVIVGPDKILFVLNTLRNERGVQIVNWGYYENALMAYALLALLSTFFSLGLVACTRITVEERDSKLIDGLTAALRNTHWVIIWAFIAWTIGPLLNLLDHQRHTSRWVRKVLKTSWSLLSYFVVPILIIDRVNIFSAVGRSVSVMTNTWGKGAVSQLGLSWFFLLMNVPTIALFAYGHYLEGPWPRTLTFVVLAMFYGTVVVYQTASSVLSVVLYKYALDGTLVDGFKKEWMVEAFVRPKVYVLVDEEPEAGYEVAAPESSEGEGADGDSVSGPDTAESVDTSDGEAVAPVVENDAATEPDSSAAEEVVEGRVDDAPRDDVSLDDVGTDEAPPEDKNA